MQKNKWKIKIKFLKDKKQNRMLAHQERQTKN